MNCKPSNSTQVGNKRHSVNLKLYKFRAVNYITIYITATALL